MSRRIIYSDTDAFTGSAGNLNAHLTAAGNGWENRSTRLGTIHTDGAGRIHCGAANASFVFYAINPLHAALTTLLADRAVIFSPALSMSARMTTESAVNLAARGYVLGCIGVADLANNGMGACFANDTFGASFTDYNLIGLVELINGNTAFTRTNFLSQTFQNESLLNQSTVEVFWDSYQTDVQWKINAPVGDRAISSNYSSNAIEFRASSLLVPGLMLLDNEAGSAVNRMYVEAFAFTYAINEPLSLSPTWVDYGSRALIQTGQLSFSDNASFLAAETVSGALVNVGGFDFKIAKYYGDRLLNVKSLIIDNRRNPSVVDVFIGPQRWRAAANSEMEIPIPEGSNTDLISLRGGGTGCEARMFAEYVPLTFRQ